MRFRQYSLTKKFLIMKKFSFLSFLLVGLFLVTSCNDDDDNNNQDDNVTTPNIVELAQATGDLSLLVEAVIHADLATTLSGGEYTVFAPTNAAFEAALTALGFDEITDIPSEDLAQILLYHVVEGDIRSTDLTDTYVTTLNTQGPGGVNTSLQVQVTGGVEFGGGASPADPALLDVEASNGVVHVIDAVMLPKNVVELASDNESFSTLELALGATQVDYVGTLSGTGPFTVFAPLNDAFVALLDSNDDWNSLTDIPEATVDAVLQYHVISGANVQSGDLEAGAVETFGGSDITISLTNGAQIETTSGQTVNIVVTNVQGTNGVIHAIDAVLVP
jgi:transforming growth factor-beta-induced protein